AGPERVDPALRLGHLVEPADGQRLGERRQPRVRLRRDHPVHRSRRHDRLVRHRRLHRCHAQRLDGEHLRVSGRQARRDAVVPLRRGERGQAAQGVLRRRQCRRAERQRRLPRGQRRAL
ncbi:MAG: Glutamyl endopeptidase precursor, blaSE, partial [uncultured Blastococcus sp.]